MKKSLIQLSTLFVISIVFFQCSITGPITTNDTVQLDPNFAGYAGVLLIVRNADTKNGLNEIDRTMLKYFKRDYKGEILMISTYHVHMYPDIEKYRWVVTPGFIPNPSIGTGANYRGVPFSRIHLKDRKTGKETETKIYNANKAFKDFPKVFEALRSSK